MATITGGANPDTLFGGTDDDRIEGLDGNDTLLGGGGDDQLVGGAGGDKLLGGAGLDLALYMHSSPVLINLTTGVVHGGEAVGDTFTSIEGLLGSSGNDILIGNGEDNVLIGALGNDVLNGGWSRDTLYGNEGDDTLTGGSGDDTMTGGAGADHFDGLYDIDTVTYSAAHEHASLNLATGGIGGAAAGDSYEAVENVIGTRFNETIIGDGAANHIWGFGGRDIIQGAGGSDRLTGVGNFSGGTGHDTIDPFGGENLINGDGGNDVLQGGVKATINGGAGNDTIACFGSMSDRFSGGGNADIFFYGSTYESRPGPANQDNIIDFTQAQGDRIDLSHMDADITTEGTDDAFAFIGTAAFSGNSAELRYINIRNQNASFIQADIDGNGAADMQVRFSGIIAFTAGDFIP